MLSIPLLTFSSSSAVLSGFVMLTEPLKLAHSIYSCGSRMLITRDYFALNNALVFCCTASHFSISMALPSLSTLLLKSGVSAVGRLRRPLHVQYQKYSSLLATK